MAAKQDAVALLKADHRKVEELFEKFEKTKSEDKKAASDTVTMRKLAPTVRYEGVLLAEMAGTIGAFAEVPADVLILGGSKGLPFLKPAMDALAQTLPHSRRVEFPGLDHGGSSDASGTNPGGGKPEIVAEEIRRFFSRR